LPPLPVRGLELEPGLVLALELGLALGQVLVPVPDSQ